MGARAELRHALALQAIACCLLQPCSQVLCHHRRVAEPLGCRRCVVQADSLVVRSLIVILSRGWKEAGHKPSPSSIGRFHTRLKRADWGGPEGP